MLKSHFDINYKFDKCLMWCYKIYILGGDSYMSSV
jgi:hypothetical protein